MRNLPYLLLCLLALAAWSQPARAARSYDGCTAFITTLPVTINAPGTYCLKKNLTTFFPTPPAGRAIYVQQPNVTIDCNDFTVQDTDAFPNQNYGIDVEPYDHVIVRHCHVKGFFAGIYMQGGVGGSNFVAEDNLLDGNVIGILVNGIASTVRHNHVIHSQATGIATVGTVDVLDNTIEGVVAPSSGNASATGISVDANPGGRISGNDVRGLAKAGTGSEFGLDAEDTDRLTIRNNTFTGDGSAGSIGMACLSSNGRAMDNVVSGFATALSNCSNVSGNDISP